ncbi:MAG: Methyltransferase [Eubacterium sp.]|nr:Methyltransferase [Eubacterium sp.]
MNTERFSGKASIYERYRPEYPAAFIDHLYNEIGFSSDSSIADIGAGTGILTRQLLEKGSRVFGVEPNCDMRNNAEQKLSRYKNFVSINGTAENTKLNSSSMDYITVAQAFHWFDANLFREECERILKPEGEVVLVWNSRIADSPMIIENAEICKRFCPEFKGFTGGQDENPSDFSSFFKDGIYDVRCFDNNIAYSLEGFIGRNLSASYAPKAEAAEYNSFVSAISDLFGKYAHGGSIIVPNITRCYAGKV